MIGLPFGIFITRYLDSAIADNLAADATSIGWSISDQFGFESCDVTIRGTIEDVLYYFMLLSSGVVVYGPDAEICWEGFLNAVDAKIGQETHSRSLDAMANLIRVRYTTVLGSPGVTANQSDTDSQAAYRVKHGVERLGQMTSAAAVAQCTRILNNRRWPGKQPSSTVATGEQGTIEITLHFVGWYGMLDWLLTANSTTTNAVTTTQVTDMITAYNATNNVFNASDFTNVTASGLSDTQFIPDDTTYRAAIERVLNQGNSSGTRNAWGFYERVLFWCASWAGATPSTDTYRRTLDGTIEYAGGGSVNLWNLRPNAMYVILELLDIQPQSTEVDAAARYYVARTTFKADSSGMSATLEPTDVNDITAQIARFTRSN